MKKEIEQLLLSNNLEDVILGIRLIEPRETVDIRHNLKLDKCIYVLTNSGLFFIGSFLIMRCMTRLIPVDSSYIFYDFKTNFL